ncbi:hypothetical protein C4K08_2607 [Pseudomonas chlororaphis subsp. aureofaciens]|nr:hypothetical protein C4K08_2607 [Pseudomonas chlororaphis subsp. aureofaciens]
MQLVGGLQARWQVLAQGVVEQVADPAAVLPLQQGLGAAYVIEHRRVEEGGEGHHHRAFHGARVVGQGQQGRQAAPGGGHHMVDLETLDQRQQDRHFVVLGHQALVRVVWPRVAGERQVEHHHIEMLGQAAAGAGEGGGGGHGAVDQQHRLALRVVAQLFDIHTVVVERFLDHTMVTPHSTPPFVAFDGAKESAAAEIQLSCAGCFYSRVSALSDRRGLTAVIPRPWQAGSVRRSGERRVPLAVA